MTQDKSKGVVDLNAHDAEYSAKIASVKGGAKVPLGGSHMPPIPRFDQAPPDRHQGVQGRPTAHQMLSPQQQAEMAASGQMIPGVGSAYAANQPNPQPPGSVEIQPQQAGGGSYVNPPRGEGAGLRPETVQQLEGIAKAQEEERAKVDKDLEDADEELANITDGWETDEFGNRIRSVLNNKKRRDAIESRLGSLNVADLISLGEVRQKVPIIVGTLEPTYRSVGGNEDLFIKKLMSAERGSDQYIVDTYSLMNLALGLHAINGRDLPTHLKDGEPDADLFKAKLKIVGKMPLTLLADLSINYVWFGRRLQKLFVAENFVSF